MDFQESLGYRDDLNRLQRMHVFDVDGSLSKVIRGHPVIFLLFAAAVVSICCIPSSDYLINLNYILLTIITQL